MNPHRMNPRSLHQLVFLQTSQVRSFLVQLLAFVFLTNLQLALYAQSFVDNFATKPIRGRGILSVQTELHVNNSTGYSYAKVLVKDIKGVSSSDRDLVVVLYVKDWGNSGSAIGYRYPVRLAEGQASVTLEIPFVGMGDRQAAWDLAVFEEGRDIEDEDSRPPNTPSYQWIFSNSSNDLPVGCLISATEDPAVEFKNVVEISPTATLGFTPNTGPAMMAGNPSIQTEVIRVADGSDDWRRYFPCSMWLVSAAAVAEINQQRPEVATALRNYTAAGGSLFIYGASTAEAIDEVKRFLSVDVNNPLHKPWRFTYEGAFVSDIAALLDRSTYRYTVRILTRPWGNGRVLLTNNSIESLPADPLAATLDRGRVTSWQLPSDDYDGNWFWRNMISSVGKPPIWYFVAIVTLFGTFLGPGLLYFTGRLKRRSLMIFLVPACSFVATMLIIGYGVLHEGFETHVRIASVTVYDAPAKVGFAWSRQNYFSGLPPRAGLAFPEQSFVRPVYAEVGNYYSGSPDPRQGVRSIVEVMDKQVWKGWLLPRQHQQLMVGHVVDAGTLPITLTRGAEQELIIKNLTAATLPVVVARGEADQYFTAIDLQPHEERRCAAEDRDSAAKTTGRVGVAARPRIPPEMQGSSGNLLSFGRSGRQTNNRVNEVTDLINTIYRRTMTDQLELSPFEFATLVPVFEPVVVPVAGRQSQNVHLVTGVAPW